MRSIYSISRKSIRYVLYLAGIGGLLQPLTAQDAIFSQSQIQGSKRDQIELQTQTTQIMDRLQSIISDLESNGVFGTDIKMVNEVKAAVTHLTEKEMEQVLSSLQCATQSTVPEEAQQCIMDAYLGQQGIILRIERILQEYHARLSAHDLSIRFAELSERQGAAVETISGNTDETSTVFLTPIRQTVLQVLQSDQEALSSEITVANELLAKAAAQGGSSPHGRPLQEALSFAEQGMLQQIADRASEDLKVGFEGGELWSRTFVRTGRDCEDLKGGWLWMRRATNDQRNIRDQLHQIALMLDPPRDLHQAIQDQIAGVARLIEKQEQLMDQSHSVTSNNLMITDLDSKQGALLEEADVIGNDISVVSAAASDLVKQSKIPMLDSQNNLLSWAVTENIENTFGSHHYQYTQANHAQGKKESIENAIESQKLVLGKLQQAKELLTQQLASTQKVEDDAKKNTVSKLQNLQKRILAQEQEQQRIVQQTNRALNSMPADPEAVEEARIGQILLQPLVSNLIQKSSPLSMGAAQALAYAAQKMHQAQGDLAANPIDTENIPADQQAAQDALSRANSKIQQQLSDMVPATPASLNAANDALQKARSDLDDTTSSAQATALINPQNSIAKRLQQADQKDTQWTMSDIPRSLPMQAGKIAADGTQDVLGTAQKAGGDANHNVDPNLQNMQKQVQAQQLQQKQAPQQAGDAVHSIQLDSQKPVEAQQQVSQMQEQHTPPGTLYTAYDALQKAEENIQNAAKTLGLPEAAATALKNAQESIAKGQQQADQKNAQGVMDAVNQAQQNLVQAQAAIAQAMAGMNGMNFPPNDIQTANNAPPISNMSGSPHDQDRKIGTGTVMSQDIPGQNISGAGKFIPLAARDRETIQQSQTENRPMEYASDIDQYMKNLSDEASSSAQDLHH